MRLECPKCGKYNNVSTNFHINCGSCAHRLDDKVFKYQTVIKGFGGVTVFALMTVSGAIGVAGSNFFENENIVTSRDYEFLEVCVRKAEGRYLTYSEDFNGGGGYGYGDISGAVFLENRNKQIKTCICAFNKVKSKLPINATDELFLESFRGEVHNCRRAT